jgi:uncharacterized protein involved in oxidation of intracellular sulfur
MRMRVLVVASGNPYDGSDNVWNAVRIAAFERDLGHDVDLFLLSDAVTLVHRATPPPADLKYDAAAELAAALRAGVVVKVCGTCLKNRELPFDGVRADVPVGTLKDLADWLAAAARVVSF